MLVFQDRVVKPGKLIHGQLCCQSQNFPEVTKMMVMPLKNLPWVFDNKSSLCKNIKRVVEE